MAYRAQMIFLIDYFKYGLPWDFKYFSILGLIKKLVLVKYLTKNFNSYLGNTKLISIELFSLKFCQLACVYKIPYVFHLAGDWCQINI